jgi:hypothetical protein
MISPTGDGVFRGGADLVDVNRSGISRISTMPGTTSLLNVNMNPTPITTIIINS